MRRAPLLPLALALMAGIAVSHAVAADPMTWLLAAAAVGCGVGVGLLWGEKGHRIAVAMALLLAVVAGGWLQSLAVQHDWTRTATGKTYLAVRLTETPQPRGKTLRARAEVEAIGQQSQPASGIITLYFKPDGNLHYGDRLLLHAYTDLQHRSVYVTPDHYMLLSRDSTSLRSRAEKLRQSLLRRVHAGPLAPHEAAVVEALALGWRADIEEDTQTAFRNAGLAHLLAVSGLHVGLLAAMVGGLLWPLGKERKGKLIRGAAQLMTVWIFALFTGLAPSTIRAELMFSLFIASDLGERRTPKLNILAASAIITLSARPLLLFDLGWQLSYSAVCAIVLARPAVAAFRSRIAQGAAVSTAATLGTLPVCCGVFHRLPLYFLVANVVVVPLSGLLLALALLYVALPCEAVGWCVGLLMRGIEWFTAAVASLPGAVVEGLHPSPFGLVAIAISSLALLLSARLIPQKNNT